MALRRSNLNLNLFKKIKDHEYTGNSRIQSRNQPKKDEEEAKRLIELFIPSQFPKDAQVAPEMLEHESKIKQLALLGVKSAIEFYQGVMIDYSTRKCPILDMPSRERLLASIREIAFAIKDPELLFRLSSLKIESMSDIDPLVCLRLAAEMTGEFAARSALELAKHYKDASDPLNQTKYFSCLDLTLKNVFYLNNYDCLGLYILLLPKIKAKMQVDRKLTPQESKEMIDKYFEEQAQLGNVEVMYYFAWSLTVDLYQEEASYYKNHDANIEKAIKLHSEIITKASDSSLISAAAYLLYLFKKPYVFKSGDSLKVRREGYLALEQGSNLGDPTCARDLGEIKLKKGEDIKAIECFNLAIANSTSGNRAKMRKNICDFMRKEKKLNSEININYYFQLCADFFNDYAQTTQTRHTMLYTCVIQGLKQLVSSCKGDVLQQLLNQWEDYSVHSQTFTNHLFRLNTRVKVDEAIRKIIMAAKPVYLETEELQISQRMTLGQQ